MSDLFEVPNEKINRNPQAAYQLDTNVMRGFKTAVNNNQMRLALEYLSHVLDVLVEKVEGAPAAEEAKPQLKKAGGRKVAAAGAVEGTADVGDQEADVTA